MKKQRMTQTFFATMAAAGLLLTACNKTANEVSEATDAAALTTSTDGIASTADAITVAASASVAHQTDSVRVMHQCKGGEQRDSVALAALPAPVVTYLNTNYEGYVYHKGFSTKDSAGAITGYGVIIYYNDKPVGLQFDASGAFVKVLEQRDKESGRGGKRGNHFGNRDGRQRDSLSISALPHAVANYFQTNYSSDTLLKAYRNVDSSLVVLSKNNGLFATVFDASNNFVKRNAMNERKSHTQEIAQAALPAPISMYLSTTYPAYVFQKAYVQKDGTDVKGYVVFIDANNTKYAVAFDASGTFAAARTIR